MEEPIWVYFGVLAAIVTIGIIVSLMYMNTQEQKGYVSQGAIDKLKAECDFVCASIPGTLLAVEVELPSGLVLKAFEKKICGYYVEDIKCAYCDCDIQDYELNLNTSLARKTFSIHTYNCYFERFDNDVAMECKG